MLPPLLFVFVVGVLVALDAGLRHAGFYASLAWPAGWREVPPDRRKPAPYREAPRSGWVLVVEPGVPRAVSIVFPPVLGVALLWSFATVLALEDLPDVLRGARSLAFVLASLSLCVIRALAAGTSLFAASERRGSLFFVASGLGWGSTWRSPVSGSPAPTTGPTTCTWPSRAGPRRRR